MRIWMDFGDRLGWDLRSATRQLTSKPLFTAISVLSLGLGIGATTAIFSVVYAILIDPFPYRAADRVGSLWLIDQRGQQHGLSYTPGQYREIRQRMRVMEDAAAFKTSTAVLSEPGFPQVVTLDECSRNLFDFFGVPPLFGREFSPREETTSAAAASVAVLSYSFWQRTFQGRHDILGQQLRLNNSLYTIIGVLPIRFTWNDADVYAPMETRPASTDLINILYRVRPHVLERQIATEFEPILVEFQKQVPHWLYPDSPFHATFVNIGKAVLGRFETTLLVLFGAVTMLLLIACSNVANLLLTRASARETEMAVRVSLGASRGRLLTQLFTENLVLALVGGVAGVLVARWGNAAAVALLPPLLFPHEASITLNWPVLWFAIAASLATGLIFGLFPGLRLLDQKHLQALRLAGKVSEIGHSRFRMHHLLIVAEISLSFTLLTGTALALRALIAAQHVSLGYDPRNVLTFLVPLEEGRFTQWAQRQTFFEELIQRLRRLPRVQAVSATAIGVPPFNGGGPATLILDQPAFPGLQAPQVSWNLVSDDYFRTMRTPLLRGRDLQLPDILNAKRVAVITEDLAKSYFPAGQNPIGRHFQIDLFDQPIPPAWLKAPRFSNSFEIVGVAVAARNRGLGVRAQPAVFLPYAVLSPPGMFVCIRTNSDLPGLLGRVRQVVRDIDPRQPITQVGSLQQSLASAAASPRFTGFLFTVFGGVGVLLAGAGVFGVTSWATAQRTGEFGIRMALGAMPADVLKLVLQSMSQVVLIGLLVGFGLSTVLGVTLSSRMEGMGYRDAPILTYVALILAVAALLACLVPAFSATQIQPMDALRNE